LVVAIRPLRVAELAEVLAVDFDDAEGMPKLNADWRWEDKEQALLIACSSLITIVGAGDSRVVQFSHFSVKEFLTSSRLATASRETSDYFIDLKPAHTTLAQACLCVLLQTHDDDDGHTHDHPLALYAAQHWTTHAQIENVSSRLQKGMEYIFDPDKPHFEVWRTLYDIDIRPLHNTATFFLFTSFGKSVAAPLYYAALCGFYDTVEHLIIKHRQDVNANGGHHMRPLLAALAGKHFKTAELLHHNGADCADSRLHHDIFLWTPLHSAAYCGDLEVVQKLIEYDVNINAKDSDWYIPLHLASGDSSTKDLSVTRPSVIRLLLDHGADVNARAKNSSTPLHWASKYGAPEVVRVLLEHGADVKAKDNDGRTALQLTEKDEAQVGTRDVVMKLLLEHEAK
jgi:ankyrin repeat protein